MTDQSIPGVVVTDVEGEETQWAMMVRERALGKGAGNKRSAAEPMWAVAYALLRLESLLKREAAVVASEPPPS